MKIKKMFLGLMVSLVVIALLLSVTERPTKAQGASDSEMLRKLDQVLNSQKDIIDRMESIKEELRIIKVRVTQAQ